MADVETVVVEVKSAWGSKIIWTQIIGVLAMAATLFGFDIPPDMQGEIVGGIGALQGIVTLILKKWFTSTVTPSSVPADAVVITR